VSTLATYAAKAVKNGRRVAGQLKTKDVMNERTQTRKGFCVVKLPDHSTLSTNPLAEALIDTPSPRCPIMSRSAWISPPGCAPLPEGSPHHSGHGQKREDAGPGQKYGLSRARISQKRREYGSDWMRFTDDRP